jgi:hypothetical protein
MGVEHLKGKRSGRPRGSKSAPPWKRDALWVYRNFSKADAEPPSSFAARLLAQAREQPDRLLTALALLDGPAGRSSGRHPDQDSPVRKTGGPASGRLSDGVQNDVGGVKTFSLPVAGPVAWMMGHPEPGWMSRLPDGCEVLSVVLNRTRRRIVLTVRHSSFPAVPDGQPVPLEQCD